MHPTNEHMLVAISCILGKGDTPELLRRLRIQAMNDSDVTTFSPRIEQLVTPARDKLLLENFAGVRTSDIFDPDVQDELRNATIGGIRNLDIMLKLSPVQKLVDDFKANPTPEKALNMKNS